MSSSSLRLQSSPRLQISSLGLMKDMPSVSIEFLAKNGCLNSLENDEMYKS